jgi:hypothetical protein
MATARAPSCSRRLVMSAVVAKRAGARGEGVGPGGGGGSLPLMMNNGCSGHDKSRSRQMRLLRS